MTASVNLEPPRARPAPPVIERPELAAWLRLLETKGVGRSSARRLLAALGSPQAIFDASPALWRELVTGSVAEALSRPPENLPSLIDTTWRWLQDGESGTRTVLCLGDPAYPAPWLHIADPPLCLYAEGQLNRLAAPSVAIVGSRGATPQGLENARAFAQCLSEGGITVVSGLAGGIDGAAHTGALDGMASTVALVGTGLDRVYPKQHLSLAHRIAREGLMLSEYPLGSPPLAAHFPQRNRLIAGLSLGTLVVEAALQSGSLITARLAMEAGREVFAIPGSIHAPQSRGCHALIKQGAKLVECAQDILEELQGWPTPAHSPNPADPSTASETPAATDPLLDALGHDPMSLDALAARTGWSPQMLNVRLLSLELEGHVARLPGHWFQRVARG